jgi:hypothetical protein
MLCRVAGQAFPMINTSITRLQEGKGGSVAVSMENYGKALVVRFKQQEGKDPHVPGGHGWVGNIVVLAI